MKTIWKFEIAVTDQQTIEMPRDAKILSAEPGPTLMSLLIWAIVDPIAPTEPRPIVVVGTGNPIWSVGRFIATVPAHPFVWHVFEAEEQ